MKTIGLIGGIGPPSTVKYYEWLNEGVLAALGGNHSAKILMTSLNGEDVKGFRLANDDAGEGAFYAAEALRLERAGADFVMIASNTSHKNAPYIKKALSVPLLHIAEATASRVASAGIKTVGLIGTAFTMEQGFYRAFLEEVGVATVIPEEVDRAFITDAIYQEMTKNVIRPKVSARTRDIIARLQEKGAEGVILGCTELTLLDLAGASCPLFDTARIHVDAALALVLK